MTSKSPEAFRTISEVAEALDVPPHVLRFWETRFAQVKPVKRGGGRRYYRPDDVRLLRGIRGLLYDDGMTIKGVQKILREKGIRHLVELGTVPEAEAPPEPVRARPRGKPAQKPARKPATKPTPRTAPTLAPQHELFPAEADSGGVGLAPARTGSKPVDAASRAIQQQELRRLLGELEALREVMIDGARD